MNPEAVVFRASPSPAPQGFFPVTRDDFVLEPCRAQGFLCPNLASRLQPDAIVTAVPSIILVCGPIFVLVSCLAIAGLVVTPEAEGQQVDLGHPGSARLRLHSGFVLAARHNELSREGARVSAAREP